MPAARRTRLAKLSINESSGVDKPANHTQFGGDGWIVVKADGTRGVAKAMTTCTDAGCNLKVLGGAAKCPDGHVQDTKTTKGADVPDKTEAEKAAELAKAMESLPAPIRELLEKQAADLKAAQDTVATMKAEAEAKVNKSAEQIEAEKAAELTKALEGLPAPVRAAFEKQQSDAAAAIKKAEEADKVAKAERDRRLDAEFVTKAEALGQPATFGPVLRAVNEGTATADQLGELERVLRAAKEQADTNDRLTKRAGQYGDSPTEGSAWASIVKAAGELRAAAEAAGNPMTEAMAIDKAAQLNPDLAAKYREEMA
jgi:hypothetical protein